LRSDNYLFNARLRRTSPRLELRNALGRSTPQTRLGQTQPQPPKQKRRVR